MTWPDEGGRSLLKYVIPPFEAATGARVIADLTGSTSEMAAKIKAQQANPQYDVVTLNSVGAFEVAAAGLLEKPDANKLPNLSMVIPKMRLGAHGFGVGYTLWSEGLVYGKKVFRNPPGTWEVLWDKAHAKKLVVVPSSWSGMTELVIMAARLAGGNERNSEPGWKKLAELKDRVLIVGQNPSQVAELFRAGSLDVGSYPYLAFPSYFGKPEYAIGAALSEMKEGFFVDPQFFVIPKRHPGNSDVIHAFINQGLDPRVQGQLAEATLQGPVNRNTVFSPKASPLIVRPEQAQAKAISFDVEYVASVRGEWARRYADIFGG
jgi:putative spermidine/putrescine transport system substrate-binding protein